MKIAHRPKTGNEAEPNPRYIDFLSNQVERSSAKRRHSDIPHSHIEESGASGIACPCPLCKIDIPSAPLQEEVFQFIQGAEEKSFTWMLQQLAEASEFKDIALPIPETVVFRKSKPAFLLQLSKDMFLRSNMIADKIRKEDIIRNFTNIVRARKRDETTMTPLGKYSKALNKSTGSAETTSYGKEIALIRYFTTGHDNEEPCERPQDEEGPLRVTLESEFFEMMFERGGSSLWKSLVYIQTVLRSRVGLNEAIFCTYNSKNPGKKVNSNEVWLMKKQPGEYCKLLMRRIAEVLADFSYVEVLSMECEFIKDDHGVLWLHYVRRLFIKQLPQLISQTQAVVKEEAKAEPELPAQELSVEAESDFIENPNINRLRSMMHGMYQEIKTKSGIESVLKEQPKDFPTIDAFSKLRPRCKFSFDEILNFGSNPPTLARSRVLSASGSRQKRSVKFSRVLTSVSRQKSPSKSMSVWHYTPRLRVNHMKLSGKRNVLSLNDFNCV